MGIWQMSHNKYYVKLEEREFGCFKYVEQK
jgi:hypothetical protein